MRRLKRMRNQDERDRVLARIGKLLALEMQSKRPRKDAIVARKTRLQALLREAQEMATPGAKW